MAVADTITSMGTNLGKAYNAIEAKGGIMPGQKNMANLKPSIESIPSSAPIPMGPWGRVLWMEDGELKGYGLQSEADLNALCTIGNETTTVNINGEAVVKSKIISFEWGENFPTTIPNAFLYHFSSLFEGNAGIVPEGVTSIVANFLAYCTIFNQEVTLPETLTTVGSGFLSGCSNFNHPITLPAQVTAIPGAFLSLCSSFNSNLTITAPEVTSIGASFLGSCTSFDKPITINGDNLVVGDSFLSGANSFNSQIAFNGTISTIGNNFMRGCTAYNQTLTLTGTGITNIGNYFLEGCTSFAKQFRVPNTVTSIGTYFCSRTNFNVLYWEAGSTITSIPNFFMYMSQGVTFFQTSDFPKTIKRIGNHFYSSCPKFEANNMGILTVETIGDYFFYGCLALNRDILLSGVKTIGNYFLSGCSSFNSQVQLGADLTSIGDNFMMNCKHFNQVLDFPASLRTIGDGFFRGTDDFTQPLTIPSWVTSVGSQFMYSQRNFVGPLTVNSSAAPTDMYSLTGSFIGAPSYTTGITLNGTYANLWKEKLPDRTDSPFRKLIVETAATANTMSAKNIASVATQAPGQPEYDRFVDPETGEETWVKRVQEVEVVEEA